MTLVSRTLFACTLLFTVSAAQAVSISVGSYQYEGSGLPGGDLGAAMQNPANFANFGYTGVVNAGEVGFGGITSAYLDNVDMFFTDRNGISGSPGAGDIGLLSQWVNDGGVLVIHNDRSTSFTSLDPLLNAFNVDIVEAGTANIETLQIDNPSHPIMNGPFGVVNSMGLRDASRFVALDPGVETIASWQNGDAAILALGPGAGRLGAVIVLPDVERFLLGFGASLGEGDTEIAALNAVAYGTSVVLNPVPVPAAVWLFGTALIGLLGFGGRKRAG